MANTPTDEVVDALLGELRPLAKRDGDYSFNARCYGALSFLRARVGDQAEEIEQLRDENANLAAALRAPPLRIGRRCHLARR
jgi:hypothetical protein